MNEKKITVQSDVTADRKWQISTVLMGPTQHPIIGPQIKRLERETYHLLLMNS